ncbi:MAG: zinc-ribbon domain-containing protein [Myxococcota bacterium]
MIIKCDKCQTSFKLPDEKVKPEGTKVRCSKCKNIFTVYPIRHTSKASEDVIEEKTRIGFVPTPFGEEQDDDNPITIKKQKENISPSIETLGHGITLSSVEIKKIEEIDQNLNEIMSSIESGIKDRIPQISDIMGDISKGTELSGSEAPARLEAGTTDTNQNDTSFDIGSLLDSLSDIPASKSSTTQPPPAEAPTEEIPDLSTLLSSQTQKAQSKEQIPIIPDINELISIQGHPDMSQKPMATDTNLIQPEPISKQMEKGVEANLSIDIDKAFDSLFAESEPTKGAGQPPEQEKQARKTMLYMEAVPVASQNSPEPQVNQAIGPIPSITKKAASPEIGTFDNLQIQDNLLSDDLSMFSPPQSTPQLPNQIPPPAPTLNLGDDLLSEIPISQLKPPTSPAEPVSTGGLLDDGISFSFGELGYNTQEPQKSSDAGRFSPDANRSDDLLSQMDSMDNINIPIPSPQEIPKAAAKKSIREEINIVTENEAKTVPQEGANVSVPLKPATIALKETKKDIKGEIIRWLFTLIFGGVIILFFLTPSYIFPEINSGIGLIVNNPLSDNSISIENLYYRQLNRTDTLMIFSGYISLKKSIPPDNIILVFRISDLMGSEIVQIDYPLTYSEKYEDVLNIRNANEIKEFLQKNRIKIITQKESPFIAPLIISNIDITRIDVKASIKIRPQ